MKSLVIHLPDYAFVKASEEADELHVPLSMLCANVLADYFLPSVPAFVSQDHSSPHSEAISAKVDQVEGRMPGRSSFSVALHFPGFPKGSIELAQAFSDAALDLFPPRGFSEIVAARDGRAIKISPNFVRIEYVMSKGGNSGIGVSFYGEPHRHTNPPKILVKGLPSYSRAKIYTTDDLAAVLPHVRQAYELKYGPN